MYNFVDYVNYVRFFEIKIYFNGLKFKLKFKIIKGMEDFFKI